MREKDFSHWDGLLSDRHVILYRNKEINQNVLTNFMKIKIYNIFKI